MNENFDYRQTVALLDGRNLRVGDTVYDLEGRALLVHPTIHCDYVMNLEVVAEPRVGLPKRMWLTNTHFEGTQVVFWERP